MNAAPPGRLAGRRPPGGRTSSRAPRRIVLQPANCPFATLNSIEERRPINELLLFHEILVLGPAYYAPVLDPTDFLVPMSGLCREIPGKL
ncbi:jg22956 [Pararge aegeria aegeria]|uniref:Jg22956 protein n=1 Tax=Pararge aegeria aegeria TaxID=348720 RepID=A0A8S4QZ44_9NEOP|nr:jg22956 [Pararge aegeria aegeria]